MYTALAATSVTLAQYVRQRLESDPDLDAMFDPADGGTMVVSLSNPKELAGQQFEGLSMWLYRVVRDDEQLNAPPVRETARDRRMPPLPVRLHYLITPMVRPGTAGAPELEQRILGKVMQALYDHACFRGPDLQGDFSGTTIEFNVRLETMSLEEITRVWSALDQSYQLSISYEVSMVAIRSDRMEAVTPVMVAEPQWAVIVGSEEG